MTTLPSGFTPTLTPTFAFAVRTGVGPSSDAPEGLTALVLAPKTSAGTADVNVPVEVFGSDDANLKFGARSRAAAACRAFRLIAPRASLWAVPLPDPVGATAASITVTFTGPATATGVLRTRIAGTRLRDVVIPSGMTATQASAAFAAAVAEYSELPVTGAVGGTGNEHITTLTAENPGAAGNQIRIAVELVDVTGITVQLAARSAVSTRDKAYLASGAGNVVLTTALAAVAGTRFDRIIGDVDDDTNRTAVRDHLVSQSNINVGHRCRGFVGSSASSLSGSGSVAEDATALNSDRVTLCYQRKAYRPLCEVAAAVCAATIYGDGRLPGEVQYRAAKANGLSLAPAVEATDIEERLSGTEVASLLAAGVTVIGQGSDGYANVVRHVTTRTRNTQGGLSYAVIDPSKVAVADLVADRCEAWSSQNYADKNIVPDPASIEQAPSSPYVTWPSAIREDILAILRQMEGEALLVNVNDHADQVTVTRVTTGGTTYAIVTCPFDVIPHLHSVVGEAQQIG